MPLLPAVVEQGSRKPGWALFETVEGGRTWSGQSSGQCAYSSKVRVRVQHTQSTEQQQKAGKTWRWSWSCSSPKVR